MVKSGIASVPQIAQQYAQERTKTISQKPQVGAPLIPNFEARRDVFPDLDNFNTQRAIYQKLDTIQLRQAEKLNNTNVASLEKHWATEEGRQLAADLHRLMSENPWGGNTSSGSTSAGFQISASSQELKQMVREFLQMAAIARLPSGSAQKLRLSKVAARNNSSKTSGKNQDAVALWGSMNTAKRNWAQTSSFSAPTKALALDRHHNNASNSSITWSTVSASMSPFLNNAVAALGRTSQASNCRMRTWKAVDVESLRWSTVRSDSCRYPGSQSLKVGLCRASGFGTAPIRYQQSMPTGPP